MKLTDLIYELTSLENKYLNEGKEPNEIDVVIRDAGSTYKLHDVERHTDKPTIWIEKEN